MKPLNVYKIISPVSDPGGGGGIEKIARARILDVKGRKKSSS